MNSSPTEVCQNFNVPKFRSTFHSGQTRRPAPTSQYGVPLSSQVCMNVKGIEAEFKKKRKRIENLYVNNFEFSNWVTERILLFLLVFVFLFGFYKFLHRTHPLLTQRLEPRSSPSCPPSSASGTMEPKRQYALPRYSGHF